MRALALLLLASLLACCSFATQPSGRYSLSVVSGDGQSGYAVQGPHGQVATWLAPLVVEVRDVSTNGLVDNVGVRFVGAVPDPPLGLGTSVSGWPTVPGVPLMTGQAATLVTPYRVGISVVVAQVLPPATSNQVAFTITGLP